MPRHRKGSRIPGTFADVVRAYMASDAFRRLGPGTSRNYVREIALIERPEILGAIPAADMRPALVQGFLDGLSHRPGKAAHALTALQAIERFAVPRDLLDRPICFGVRIVRGKGGYQPWRDDQVALAEAHASPLLARAVTLAANTGQRGSDLIRMGWGDLEDYKGITGINVRQVKTGRGLWIPVTPELAAAMVGWERRPGPFLVGTRGAFSRGSLTKRWERERDTVPELAPLRDVAPGATHPHLVLHGLRATCVVRLRRAGVSIPQICDIVGMSPAMVERYCRFADQRDNALAAVASVHRIGERAKRRVE